MTKTNHKIHSTDEIFLMLKQVDSATVATHGGIHIRLRQMHYAPDENLSLYFATMKGDPKTLQLTHDPNVTILVLNRSGEMQSWSEAEFTGQMEFIKNEDEKNKARTLLIERSPIVKNLVETSADHILEWMVFKPQKIKYRVFGEIVQGIPPTFHDFAVRSVNPFIFDLGSIIRGIRTWYQAIRSLFLLATLLPVVLGITIAFVEQKNISLLLALVTIIGALFLHIGANLLNDYMDHLGGSDEANREFTRPFSGGSRVIQLGLLSPVAVLFAAILSIFLGMSIGIYLALVSGLWIWIIGGIGFTLLVTYSLPKIGLASLGIGELSIGLVFGPLMTFGAYYVQTTAFSWIPIVASIPLAGMIALVLFINEFPDIKADASVGKNNLVVKMGTLKASWVYIMWALLIFLAVIFFVSFRILPAEALATMVAIPFIIWGWVIMRRNINDPKSIIPACASTSAAHILAGLAMIAAYFADNSSLGLPIFVSILALSIWFYLYINRQKRAYEQAKQTFGTDSPRHTVN